MRLAGLDDHDKWLSEYSYKYHYSLNVIDRHLETTAHQWHAGYTTTITTINITYSVLYTLKYYYWYQSRIQPYGIRPDNEAAMYRGGNFLLG